MIHGKAAPLDYEKIKFKAGLEIHQQLDTHKLFCNCPSVLRKDEPEYEVRRKLHAVAGESGEVDIAAQYQSKLSKDFVYQGYDTTCLVELDEEPPHEINREALKIATHISLLMNCEMIPITQVMRKTVIDGSNTSGFQRTSMIAHGGYLETSEGRVGITAVLLEEDACRIIERGEKQEIFRLDRLGIPLVEVVTDPDIKNAAHAKEVALMIGDILRSCRVRRGLGTIRQDVSISVNNGERIELKGVQDIDLLPTTVENEVKRQLGLNEIAKEVSAVTPDVEDVTKNFDFKLDWMKGKSAIGFKLTGFEGILGTELFEGFRLGTELSKFAKSRGFGGIIHSDENMKEKYKFSDDEIACVKKDLGLKKGDAFVMTVGDKAAAISMFEEVLIPRINKLKSGVTSEVRNSLANGSSEFLRPMPGSARMYPETDVPLLKITRDMINDAKKDLPKLRSKIEEELRKQGLNQEMIKELFKRNALDDFKELYAVLGSSNVIGKMMFMLPKDIATREEIGLEEVYDKISQDVLVFIAEKLRDDELKENQIKEVLNRIYSGILVKDAVIFEEVNMDEIEEIVMKIVKSKPGLRPNAYMGLVMAELKGKVSGGEAMALIGKFAK